MDPFPQCVLPLWNATQATAETITQTRACSCFRISKMLNNRVAILKYKPSTINHQHTVKVSEVIRREMPLSKIFIKFIIKVTSTYSDISEKILAEVRS